MRTLIIDDDTFSVRLLARQLGQLGIDAITSRTSSADALALLEAQHESFDVIFCDLQMPDVDGVELLRHLSRIGFRGGLVLVSGEEQRVLHSVGRLARAHRISLLATLGKPVAIESLRAAVQAHAPAAGGSVPNAPQRIPAADLERGLVRAELVNHYQPKVELATAAFVGVEALVRWQHPELGLLYPDRFIATAEEHGLIDRMTEAVLRNAMDDACCWQSLGMGLQVAVNVSMDNLATLDFPETVSRIVRDAGMSPSSLVLEVTESRLMRDPAATLDIVTRLRLKRIGLSIDDFGTGNSSLAQLRDMPFDELKLDRGFVDGVARDAAQAAIVDASLSMARQLGLKTVAEGLERHEDWAYLHARGCDVAQGYLIARPMPAGRLSEWAAGWSSRCTAFAAASR